MSPRAAWRLESLGFSRVYDYAPGKADWEAAGLEVEGSLAGVPRLLDVARRDVARCTLDDRVGEVRRRLDGTPWHSAIVVDERDVVLGRLGRRTPAAPSEARVGDVMLEGPSTFRPNVTLHEMDEYMEEHDLGTALVTTSEGVLIGLVLREDVHGAHRAH